MPYPRRGEQGAENPEEGHALHSVAECAAGVAEGREQHGEYHGEHVAFVAEAYQESGQHDEDPRDDETAPQIESLAVQLEQLRQAVHGGPLRGRTAAGLPFHLLDRGQLEPLVDRADVAAYSVVRCEELAGGIHPKVVQERLRGTTNGVQTECSELPASGVCRWGVKCRAEK